MDVPFIYIVFNRRFDPSPAGLMVQGFQQLDMMSCFCPIFSGHFHRLIEFPKFASRMRSWWVPVSLWGSGGWGCVRSTLPNRSREGRFQTSRCLVSRGRRGTLWQSNLFDNASKVILCGRRNTFATFSDDALQFSGRRSTLDVPIIILRGRRSTSDVSCCVFFANRNVRAASSGDKVQIPWQVWHFVRCDENWRKPRTKHRFWGSKFRGS